ncbi:IclR family transcriptional regulator [Pollutimonas thiosulfatoxidans]|uniref:IclR family transcriptional regulator n=1 Tax=Pollutimonas thiosulfatoxidans TaxID=2028345 RepID=UPI000FEB71A1|nr:IclR family transcriptional regulator [Pollutimonas thiosulfatoxidans]
MKDDKPASAIKSVHVTLDILEAISQTKDGIGVSELADKLGSTKATIFRHLRTLLDRGYLSQDFASSRYRLGVRVHLLGRAAAQRVDLLTQSQQAIAELREETGESVTISAVGTRGVIVLETVFGTSVFEIGVRPGTEMQFHSSAQGKVALAFSRQPLMQWVRGRDLERFTEHTMCDHDKLEAEIEEVRELGWATAPQEMILGLNAIAVPIFDESGDCIGTLGLVGFVQFIGRQPPPGHLLALKRAGERISANLGYRRPASSK